MLPLMKIYYTYILQCSDGSFYVGMTSNLERRLQEHEFGVNEDAYTFNKRPIELKWFEEFSDAHQAIATEKQLKGWSRRKKIALIERDWEKLVKYSKNYTQFGKDGASASLA